MKQAAVVQQPPRCQAIPASDEPVRGPEPFRDPKCAHRQLDCVAHNIAVPFPEIPSKSKKNGRNRTAKNKLRNQAPARVGAPPDVDLVWAGRKILGLRDVLHGVLRWPMGRLAVYHLRLTREIDEELI